MELKKSQIHPSPKGKGLLWQEDKMTKLTFLTDEQIKKLQSKVRTGTIEELEGVIKRQEARNEKRKALMKEQKNKYS